MRQEPPAKVTPRQIRAEAASWVARLHGPDRDALLESGLRKWLVQSPMHAAEFERATDAWQESSNLPGELPDHFIGSYHRTDRRHWGRALAVVVVFSLAAIGLYYSQANTLATSLGEQKSVTLSDGTRVELNTSSRLLIKYDEHVREVVLESGEAFFDVSRQQQRPFIVVVGSRRVVALGTAFMVRRAEAGADRLTVTLLDGRVAVRGAVSQPISLSPGQRVEVNDAGVPAVDAPPIDKVTAWQHGELIFEDTPLREAVHEFNRYSKVKLRISASADGDIRVGGAFRLGDSASFAHAVADSHHLRVEDNGNQLTLK